jgi:oligo-1,6-glucosidase
MLIELLKQHEIIVYGYYELILENHESIFAYTRTLGNEKLLVINNFFEKETFFMLPEHIDYLSKELLISNYIMEPDQDIYNISLRPYELLAIKLFV